MKLTYVDTGAWIAILTNEPTADTLLNALGQTQQQLVTAQWTRTELASALGIKARRKQTTQAAVSQMLRQFEAQELIDLAFIPVETEDFLTAAQWCENIDSKLCGGDALHLSVAQRCKATHILTLDHHMQRYAQLLGMISIDIYDEKFDS